MIEKWEERLNVKITQVLDIQSMEDEVSRGPTQFTMLI